MGVETALARASARPSPGGASLGQWWGSPPQGWEASLLPRFRLGTAWRRQGPAKKYLKILRPPSTSTGRLPLVALEKDGGLVEWSRGRRAPSEEQVIGERSSRGSTRRTQKIGEVELPVDGVAVPSSSPSPHSLALTVFLVARPSSPLPPPLPPSIEVIG
ncbi:hypothetical protein NL676_004546 [Syzygium grande]|nr:hypothetical protein NL676_004546 [Syzygium grande]